MTKKRVLTGSVVHLIANPERYSNGSSGMTRCFRSFTPRRPGGRLRVSAGEAECTTDERVIANVTDRTLADCPVCAMYAAHDSKKNP